MTRDQYPGMLARDIAAIPDLHFDADMWSPRRPGGLPRRVRLHAAGGVLGFTLNGTRLHVAEHVSYRFRDGRVAEVSSLIDRTTIAAHLST